MENEKIDNKLTISSFMWKTLERVFSQGINLLVQIILARMLLPEDFGGLAILVSIINFAAIFVQAGFATAIVQKEDLDPLDISTVLTISLAVALVMYLGLFCASPFIAQIYEMPELCWALRVLSLILFLNAINSVQTAVLSRRMRFKQLFWRSAIAIPVSGIIGIGMAYVGLGIWALVAQQLSNMLCVVIIMNLEKDMRFPLRYSRERAKGIFSFSGKILLTSLTSGIYDTLRTMFIGKKYSTSDLAYYDKANTYSSYIVQIINNSVSSVLLPVFSRQQANLEDLRRMTRRSVKLSAFIMIPVLVGIASVAEPLVRIILTDKWLESVPYLVVFCFLRIPGCITTVDRQAYYAIGRSDLGLKYEIGLFVLNVTALLIVMPYGIIAMAISATVIEYIGAAALFIVSAKVYGYRLRDRLGDLIRPTVNSLLMAAAVNAVGLLNMGAIPLLLLQIASGAVVYIALSLITKDDNLIYCVNLIRNFINKKER